MNSSFPLVLSSQISSLKTCTLSFPFPLLCYILPLAFTFIYNHLIPILPTNHCPNLKIPQIQSSPNILHKSPTNTHKMLSVHINNFQQ